MIEDSQGEIWFVGDRGLFHLNPQTGQITRPPATIKGLSAIDVYEDRPAISGCWRLPRSSGWSSMNRQAERVRRIPAWRGGDAYSTAARFSRMGRRDSGCRRALGLSYFDRRTERFTRHFDTMSRSE